MKKGNVGIEIGELKGKKKEKENGGGVLKWIEEGRKILKLVIEEIGMKREGREKENIIGKIIEILEKEDF